MDTTHENSENPRTLDTHHLQDTATDQVHPQWQWPTPTVRLVTQPKLLWYNSRSVTTGSRCWPGLRIPQILIWSSSCWMCWTKSNLGRLNLASCRTHRIPPSKDALHGLILYVLQLARSDTPRLVLEHPMDWYLARWIPWTLFFCTVLQGTHSQWGMPWGGCVWMDGSCKEALIWMPGPS